MKKKHLKDEMNDYLKGGEYSEQEAMGLAFFTVTDSIGIDAAVRELKTLTHDSKTIYKCIRSFYAVEEVMKLRNKEDIKGFNKRVEAHVAKWMAA